MGNRLDEAALTDALTRVQVPAFVVDDHEIIRWQNEGARELLGDVTGKRAEQYISRHDVPRLRREFTRKLLGLSTSSESEATLVHSDGTRIPVEISSVPVRKGGHVIGVFGVVVPQPQSAVPEPPPNMTPRQLEVLRLLAQGRSTTQLAESLTIAPETVRNHIKMLLRTLGASSRLEAVVRAHELELVK